MKRSYLFWASFSGLLAAIACGNSVSGEGKVDDESNGDGDLSPGGMNGDGDLPGDGDGDGDDPTGSGGAPDSCTDDEQCPNGVPICDGGFGMCRACNGDLECEARSSDSPFCDQGTCSACRDDDDCSADSPVCGEDGQCRVCEAHAECESLACDVEAGQCIAQGKIVYILAKAGAAENCGSLELPCYGTTPALPLLSAARNYLVLQPTGASLEDYGGIVLPNVEGLTVIGHQVRIDPVDDEPAITVTAGEVTLEDMRLESPASGVECSGGAFSLLRSSVSGAENGVLASSCDVSVVDSRFSENDVGIAAGTGATVTVDRSLIEAGRLALQFSNVEQFHVQNSIFANQASTYSFDAALYLYAAEPSVFSFNTIYGITNNQGYDGIVYGVSSPITLTSNISWGNCNTQSCLDSEFTGMSNATMSYMLTTQPVVGTQNIVGDPLFVDAEGGDFSLMEDSPARDTGNPVGAPAVDFFGNPRTVGDAPDRGAIELQ